MDISGNQKIDFLYLTNPNILNKYNKQKELTEINEEEIKFYRKRILLMTKEYLRGHRENNNLDNVFFTYTKSMIEYFKFTDKKEIMQKEYSEIKTKKTKPDSNFKLIDEDKKIIKQKKNETKTIKDFLPIVVKEKKNKKLIIPKKKEFDLKNDKFRSKGI